MSWLNQAVLAMPSKPLAQSQLQKRLREPPRKRNRQIDDLIELLT
jgi:hypothetical protein